MVTKARNKAKAVFSGEVVEVIQNPQVFYVEVKFKVENSWKQARADEVIIRTGRGGGDCGYHFDVGQRYLVYAYGSNETKLETNISQRTRMLADAGEDLRLRGPIPGRSQTRQHAFQPELYEATENLFTSGMNVSIYNHQLCVLDRRLWEFARKSISDWKNIYLGECAACALREECGELFQSAAERHSA